LAKLKEQQLKLPYKGTSDLPVHSSKEDDISDSKNSNVIRLEGFNLNKLTSAKLQAQNILNNIFPR